MKWRAPVQLATLATAVVVAHGLPMSGASFTAVKANPANTFQAASSFGGGVRLATGSYTGNAVDNRAIADAGFAPDVVIVKGNNGQAAVIRTSTMAGDATKPLAGATALTANLIQSLSGSGFTIGTDSRVNQSNITYQWIALKASSAGLQLGSYTGNGGSRAVGGLPFSPEYVAVLGATARTAVQRYSGMARSFRFDADAGTTTRVTSLDSAGFTVGADNTVNSSGVTYHYLALSNNPSNVTVGGYTGTGADNRAITGAGLQPGYLMVKANDTVTSRRGVHRPASLAGDAALNFSASANAANLLQALQPDGFQLGSDGLVNANGIAYGYVAIEDAP